MVKITRKIISTSNAPRPAAPIKSEFDASSEVLLTKEQVPDEEIGLRTAAQKAAIGTEQGQAVLVDRTLYVSGILGLNKDTMKLVEGGVIEETRQALTSLGHILTASQSSYDKVVKCTILLTNINDFAAVNEVYKEFFTLDFPARTAFEVGKLPLNANVEIEAIAITGEVLTVPVADGGCCKL